MNKERRIEIASLGGRARIKIHGNPGTPEGRRKGGLASLASHQTARNGFKLLRSIRVPRHSVKLAELLGILMGDGHIGPYQVSIVTNSQTDTEHALFIKALLEELFGLPVSLKKRPDCNALVIVLSSKEACEFLSKLGMPTGNKLMKGFEIPLWIREHENFKCALVRGLIDTDGCVYKDRHLIRGKEYASTCIAFTNSSPELLNFVSDTLEGFGYTPTRSGRDLRLRRRIDVLRYAKEVGFSNPKHAAKLRV